MKKSHIIDLISKIQEDRDFIKWAIEREGLGVQFLQFKKYGPKLSEREKKTLLESLARLAISDNQHCISLIGNLFEYDDLIDIEDRIIGHGKIGGKTTGMLLAYNSINKRSLENDLDIEIPESWFLGSGVFSDFLRRNGLHRYEHSKFLKDSYEMNYQEFLDILPITTFPDEIVERITEILEETQGSPLILRSSSLLEDSFGTPFAGKYDSFFIPNSFSIEENLKMFLNAVKAIYSSVYNPNSMEYRKKKHLLNEYEAMAILIQKVIGKKLVQDDGNEYFCPLFAGVAFSQNCFPWSEYVAQEDGSSRLAFGLGTSVVDIAEEERIFIFDLSKFSIPTKNMDEFLKSSQRTVQLIDLKEKDFRNNIKSIKIDELDGTENFKGFYDIMSTADKNTGRLRAATKYSIKEDFQFITFHNFKKWGKPLRKILKVIEFSYSRLEIIEYLNQIKWDIVGEIVRIFNSSDLDFVDSDAGLHIVEIYHGLKDDTIEDFYEEKVRSYFGYDTALTKEIIRKLIIVVESKRLLKNMDKYESFKEIFNHTNSRELNNEILFIMAKNAVDMEFAVNDGKFYILQCRPLSMYENTLINEKLDEIPIEDRFIDTNWPCPNALVKGIKHVIYVDDKKYSTLTEDDKFKLSHKIGELNNKYNDFSLIIPGRAGSSHPELGVPVKYKDINNSRLLIEYPLAQHQPDFSYGSHFYLDLVGDNIFTFAVEHGNIFRKKFIYDNKIEGFFDDALILSELHQTVFLSGAEKRIVSKIENTMEELK